MLICADWRRYVNANMCLTALPVYVSCSLKSIIPICCCSCRTDSGYVRYDLIFAFRVLPRDPSIYNKQYYALETVNNSKINGLCRHFYNMLHRLLYSLLRTKGVESKEHLLRIRLQAYSMIFVCDHCSAIQPHCECGSVCFDLQCERSCRSYIFSRSLHMDISFDGILHFALLTHSSSSIFQTPYRLLSAKLISHFLNFHLISR